MMIKLRILLYLEKSGVKRDDASIVLLEITKSKMFIFS